MQSLYYKTCVYIIFIYLPAVLTNGYLFRKGVYIMDLPIDSLYHEPSIISNTLQ